MADDPSGEIRDLAALLTFVDEVDPASPRWFRGHARRWAEVRPGLLRDDADPIFIGGRNRPETATAWESPIGEAERRFNAEFRRTVKQLLPSEDDVVELYFLAQHHGMPTRLLDWTTNPLVALFFAVSEFQEHDGELIVASPGRLPGEGETQSDAGEVVCTRRSKVLQQAVSSLFDATKAPDGLRTVFILPDPNHQRIFMQAACFSLHLTNEGPAPDDLLRLVVPADRKRVFQQSLRTLGISWASLFPDLDGVCREMRARWASG